MRNATLTSITGNKINITINCYREMVVNTFDGYELPPELFESRKIIAESEDGKIKFTISYFYEKNDDDLNEKIKEIFASNSDIYGIVSGHDENGVSVKLGLAEKDYTKLITDINDDMEENTTDDARKAYELKKKNERESEIARAKRIIEKSENTIKKDNRLMTRQEAREYLKNYNDTYNEGGEGFLPEIITKEMVEQATAILQKYDAE